jgi:pteridine reductase
MHIAGKSAIVTGGAVRIGRALAIGLARRGVNVCIHYSGSESAALTALEEIRGCGVRATVVGADFMQPAAAAATVFGHADRELGPIDFLVNSAGIFEAASLMQMDETNWDRHQDINLKAPAFLCRQFARQLPDGRRGQIVNIADWRGDAPGTGYLAYTVAKAGLIALTRSLAQELAPHMQVNAIAPGAILPPPGETTDEFRQRAAGIPLRRTGAPADILQALLYLLESDFVTGHVLHVTGGAEL